MTVIFIFSFKNFDKVMGALDIFERYTRGIFAGERNQDVAPAEVMAYTYIQE